MSSQAFWDERYRSSSALWSGDPNQQLVTEANDLVPGAALDVGCGEGADAIWLADHGWLVTAVDFSAVALERARAHARRSSATVAERITWLHADLAAYAPAPASFDLVSAQFMHLPRAERELLHRRLAASVAAGGTLLIVGHDPSDLQLDIPRPPMPELFASANEVAASLPSEEWAVLTAEARPRRAVDRSGHPVAIHDAVMKARRKG